MHQIDSTLHPSNKKRSRERPGNGTLIPVMICTLALLHLHILLLPSELFLRLQTEEREWGNVSNPSLPYLDVWAW